MTNKELPICYPPISSYPQHAYYLSIMCNNEDCLSWIYCNYIHIFLMDLETSVFMDYFVSTPEHHFHPWFKASQRLSRDLILSSIPNFIKFFQEQIELGYYIWLHIDEFYISCSAAYQKQSHPHACLLYGFDDKKENFNIAGFFKNGKYSMSTVSYSEVEQSFLYCNTNDCDASTEHLKDLHLLKLRPNYHNGQPYQFDMEFIAKQMLEYYESKNPIHNFRSYYSTNLYHDWTCGLSIYKKLNNCLTLHLDKKMNIDRRPFYINWEHKKLMLARIEYIRTHNYYDFVPMVYDGYKELERNTNIILYLFLKYQITQNDSCIYSAKNLLDDVYRTEKQLLEGLLEDFQKKMLL